MNGYDPKLDETTINNTYYENFHFLLGKIIVNYNLIESKMIMLICNLVDINDITNGFIACKQKSAFQLLELLTSHINRKVKDSELLTEYNQLCTDIRKVIEQRNIFMHSIYIDPINNDNNLQINMDKVRRIRIREFEKGKKEIMSQVIFDLSSFQGLLQWILSIHQEFDGFIKSLRIELPIKDIYFKVKELPNKK